MMPVVALGMLLGATASARTPSIHAALASDGRLIISNRPAPGLRLFDPHAGRSVPHPLRRPSSTSDLLDRIAAESGIDRALLHAIARQESGLNPAAVSAAGAVGLMQLMPATAHRFGVHDRFDPEQNLRGGAAYLTWLLTHFDQDLDLALAAYNAGEGAVHRHGNRIPPYAETQAYVRAIRARFTRCGKAERVGQLQLC